MPFRSGHQPNILQSLGTMDFLFLFGKVHKIESRNSYVACKHEGCNAKTSIVSTELDSLF